MNSQARATVNNTSEAKTENSGSKSPRKGSEPAPLRSQESDRDTADSFEFTGADFGGKLGMLWAPYRKNYVAKPGANPDPFMDIPSLSDSEGLVVARGQSVYCILNLFPYNAGHMMVIPYRQVDALEELTEQESDELMAFTQKAIRVLKSVSSPDAINVGMNLGRASGGSVPMHLHQHIVPRWIGDTSFMTVISDTKVLPEILHDTWSILHDAWKGQD